MNISRIYLFDDKGTSHLIPEEKAVEYFQKGMLNSSHINEIISEK